MTTHRSEWSASANSNDIKFVLFIMDYNNLITAESVSFRATHFLIKNKKTFSDGDVFKEAVMLIAKTAFKVI